MVEIAEYEIARLQMQLAEQYDTEVALKLTTDMVANLIQNWHQSKPEVRRAFAHSVFDYLGYDLDSRRIVDFKLTPWAELLMQLKVTFKANNKNTFASDVSKSVLRCAWRGSSQQQDHCLP